MRVLRPVQKLGVKGAAKRHLGETEVDQLQIRVGSGVREHDIAQSTDYAIVERALQIPMGDVLVVVKIDDRVENVLHQLAGVVLAEFVV